VSGTGVPQKIEVSGRGLNIVKLNNTYAPTTIVDLPYPATHRSDNSKFHYSGPAIKSSSQFAKDIKPG